MLICYGCHSNALKEMPIRPSHYPTAHTLNKFQFHFKLTSIATYGIRVIWEDLTVENLEQLNRVEVSFLEGALGLDIVTRSFLAYPLPDSPLLSEDLRLWFELSAMEVFRTNFKN